MKILLFPFVVVWRLVEIITKMTGRLIAVILGFVFMIIGILLSVTVVGAILGIPLAVLGFAMILRGFF